MSESSPFTWNEASLEGVAVAGRYQIIQISASGSFTGDILRLDTQDGTTSVLSYQGSAAPPFWTWLPVTEPPAPDGSTA